jgi:hypothetical protein
MAYVRLDKISATAHLESIVATEDLVNGQFVALKSLQADGEAREVVPSGDQAEKLVLHVSNGLVYGDRENELDFVLKAGKRGRGYVPQDGDIVSISEDGVTGVSPVAVGDIVNPHANGFEIVDGTTVTEKGALHGEVIAIDIDLNAGKLAVIRISK